MPALIPQSAISSVYSDEYRPVDRTRVVITPGHMETVQPASILWEGLCNIRDVNGQIRARVEAQLSPIGSSQGTRIVAYQIVSGEYASYLCLPEDVQPIRKASEVRPPAENPRATAKTTQKG